MGVAGSVPVLHLKAQTVDEMLAVSRPYQQRGRQGVSPGSCTATRRRCHAHRRPAVIRGDAKKR
ncbi:MAG: hypothetical protein QOG79_7613, partial [Mycobacterium sp.]|nr:hypothetical protein [Mycobacterium sp.]